MDGFNSSNHLSWVCSEPEFQTVPPSPCASKKLGSTDVAPVMAKLAPRRNDALCAFDGGGIGSPSSCAAHIYANACSWKTLRSKQPRIRVGN